jgi:hypothetical protein
VAEFGYNPAARVHYALDHAGLPELLTNSILLSIGQWQAAAVSQPVEDIHVSIGQIHAALQRKPAEASLAGW